MNPIRSLLVLPLLFAATALLAQPQSRPQAVDNYLAALAQVERAPKPVSMAPLLTAAEVAQDALMQIVDEDRAWIETVDDETYAALRTELRGLSLSRGYDVYAQPDGAFLRELATRKGLDADRAFFALYADLWSDEHLPRYLSLGTRSVPCVRFDENVLPTLYTQWREFSQRHPQAYSAHVRQTLADLEEAVALGTCACGDAASVERELRGFLKRFPTTPVAGQISERLIELKSDRNLRPVHCR
ncbi:MAG TPA: hypothetical protein VGE57_00200 [Solimonas sp.]